MESEHFSWIPTRNCRRFLKRNYTLKFGIDSMLVAKLEKFGFLETYEFSKFSKTSLDLFKIRIEGELELSGLYESTSLNVLIPKKKCKN